jgi:hypothetical protein
MVSVTDPYGRILGFLDRPSFGCTRKVFVKRMVLFLQNLKVQIPQRAFLNVRNEIKYLSYGYYDIY